MYERSYHKHVLDDVKQPLPKIGLKKLIYIGASVALIVGIVFLVRIPSFQIRSATVSGTKVADPEDVSQFVLASREGAYLWVLPKSSIFLTSTKHLQEQIQSAFPRFRVVDVSRASMHGLAVEVEEYPGVYLWCDDTCSFMDEGGTVFADAPYFSGSAYVKVYSGQRAPYPFTPLRSTELALVHTLTDQLDLVGIVPVEIHIDNDHKASVLFYHNGERAELYFDPANDIDEAIDTLFTGLRSDPLQGLYKSQSHILRYIDLRFANKVVYKFD